MIGSALIDSVLSEACVEHAKAIVLAMESDADNVFAALSARVTASWWWVTATTCRAHS